MVAKKRINKIKIKMFTFGTSDGFLYGLGDNGYMYMTNPHADIGWKLLRKNPDNKEATFEFTEKDYSHITKMFEMFSKFDPSDKSKKETLNKLRRIIDHYGKTK